MTDRTKTICPPFFDPGGIKTWALEWGTLILTPVSHFLFAKKKIIINVIALNNFVELPPHLNFLPSNVLTCLNFFRSFPVTYILNLWSPVIVAKPHL